MIYPPRSWGRRKRANGDLPPPFVGEVATRAPRRGWGVRRPSRWAGGGAPDGKSFLACVEQVLVPTLKPGDIVIMVNLAGYKGQAVRRAIRFSMNRSRSRSLTSFATRGRRGRRWDRQRQWT